MLTAFHVFCEREDYTNLSLVPRVKYKMTLADKYVQSLGDMISNILS